MEPIHQPPFPGMYKTKDSVELGALRAQFHDQCGEDPISIERFLAFLKTVAAQVSGYGPGHGEGGSGGYAPSQGSYGCDD